MKQQVDYKFNERMTQARLRGVRFADVPLQMYKRESGIPYGYFKRSIWDALLNWRAK